MQKALQVLIIIGLGIWAFLLMEKYELFGIPSLSLYFDSATKDARCAMYGDDSEGGHTLEYGDRMRQFLDGCW